MTTQESLEFQIAAGRALRENLDAGSIDSKSAISIYKLSKKLSESKYTGIDPFSSDIVPIYPPGSQMLPIAGLKWHSQV